MQAMNRVVTLMSVAVLCTATLNQACAVTLPTSVADLELWLRADSGPQTSGSPSVPGDDVDLWLDSSGAANNAGGTGTPILRSRTFGPKTFPVVELSGGGDLFTTISTSLTNAGGSTYFVVFSQQGTNNGNGRFISANGAAGVNRNFTTFSNNFNTYDGANSYSYTANLQDSLFHIGVLHAAPNSPVVLLDGVFDPQSSTVAGGPFPNYNINPITALRVGADAGGSQPFLGDIAEVVVYDRFLTDDEINDVGFYLQDKYGVAGAFTVFDPNAVPEPSTLGLVVLGAIFLTRRSRRMQSKGREI